MPRLAKMTYCIFDETDPRDEFECEGSVVDSFFRTSPIFRLRRSFAFLQRNIDPIRKLPSPFYNIVHFAAHGTYFKRSKRKLDYSVLYGRSKRDLFRPDSLVRTQLQVDLFVSTCCETYNSPWIEILRGYGDIYNYIAPRGRPLIGDTVVFSLMLYNDLIRQIRRSATEIQDDAIIASFKIANEAYRAYKGQGDFRLFAIRKNREYA